LRTVSPEAPIFAATEQIASHCDPYWPVLTTLLANFRGSVTGRRVVIVPAGAHSMIARRSVPP